MTLPAPETIIREALDWLQTLIDGRSEVAVDAMATLDALVRERDRLRDWNSRLLNQIEQEAYDELHGPDSWQRDLKRGYREERDEFRDEIAATRLGAERQAQRAAMAEAQLAKALERLDVYVSSADSLAAVMYERDEARAENERLRIRYGSFLDWAIGYTTIEPEDIEGAKKNVTLPLAYFEHLNSRLREERAALAAAQEPPAAPCYVCGHPVAEGEGWRRNGKAWCPDHRPVWSHD